MPWIENEFKRYNSDPKSPRRYHDVHEYFADRCRHLRKTYGLTQAALAGALETSNITIANWENPLSEALPSRENQRRYQKAERRLWMQENWSNGLAKYDTPATTAIKALIMNLEDEEAQAAAEYLLDVLGPNLSKEKLVHLRHIAGLTYAVSSDQNSKKGRQHAENAWVEVRQLDMDGPAATLAYAIRNELLGYRNERITHLPAEEQRKNEANDIIEECFELFRISEKCGDKQIVLLWNALECACKNHPSEQNTVRILDALCRHDEKGKKYITERVKRDDLYEKARPYLSRLNDSQIKN